MYLHTSVPNARLGVPTVLYCMRLLPFAHFGLVLQNTHLALHDTRCGWQTGLACKVHTQWQAMLKQHRIHLLLSVRLLVMFLIDVSPSQSHTILPLPSAIAQRPDRGHHKSLKAPQTPSLSVRTRAQQARNDML